ncbi:uncharacterized protein LOC130765069 [Actinidia eriantha]|uniref:uncharacterized protein LOC130765069 n=1 Tax=Actinidia eriantha TaxID=165200 RepID=UPI002583E2BD|nr:uncharacterized protein LOC130765069 [Actinidia eriantha]
MAPEPTNSTDPTLKDGEKQKLLDHEIREMISSLIHKLSDLQHVRKQPAGSSHSHSHSHRHPHSHNDQEDEGGMRIITLAGSNTGASMRGELDDINSSSCGKNEALDTYVNSNFQDINNSIVLGGSYSTNDPGVHLDIISDYYDPEAGAHDHPKQVKTKVKGKKKEKESEHSD